MTAALISPVMTEKSIFSCKAKLCLRFVIVGGGIAGLATAYNLQQAGHSVLVIEKEDGVGKVGIEDYLEFVQL